MVQWWPRLWRYRNTQQEYKDESWWIVSWYQKARPNGGTSKPSQKSKKKDKNSLNSSSYLKIFSFGVHLWTNRFWRFNLGHKIWILGQHSNSLVLNWKTWALQQSWKKRTWGCFFPCWNSKELDGFVMNPKGRLLWNKSVGMQRPFDVTIIISSARCISVRPHSQS